MICLDAFEKFIHLESPDLPPLIKAGLLHVQFETIHPFLDGNGRIGRLLITLFLYAQSVLAQPLLYLSLYFKQHRSEYYRLLQEVRENGSWEAWLEFFLDGIAKTAHQAFETTTRIGDLFKADRERIQQSGERVGSVLDVYELMRTTPFLTAITAAARSGLTMPTVNSALAQLQALGIAHEITGRRRNRVFAYRAYLDILGEGAEPLKQGG
jgi:Fic family protein